MIRSFLVFSSDPPVSVMSLEENIYTFPRVFFNSSSLVMGEIYLFWFDAGGENCLCISRGGLKISDRLETVIC